MAGVSVPPRLGLASGSGMSVTTCDGGAGGNTNGSPGGASSAGVFGLRSGMSMFETAANEPGGGGALGSGGVIGTEVMVGFRSGGGTLSASCAVGFWSGRGTVPVTVVVSDAVSGAGQRRAQAQVVAAPRATGAAGFWTRVGLRSGRGGGTSTLTVLVARADLAATDFALATAGARHAIQTSNGKICARMRFISSVGFRLRSCSQDVPRAGEPRRRRHCNVPDLNNV